MPSAPLVVGPVTGVAGLPKKKKKVTGVILQVRTKTKGPDGGSLKVYGLDGAAPGSRSAPIVPGTPYTSPRGRRGRDRRQDRGGAVRAGQGQGDHRRLDPPLTS